MKKKSMILTVVCLLVLINPLLIGQEEEGKWIPSNYRVGVFGGFNFYTDSFLSDTDLSWVLGADVGYVIENHYELYAGFSWNLDTDIFQNSFSVGNILLGGYYHFNEPGPGLDVKAGGGMDIGIVSYDVGEDETGIGIWVGAAVEWPFHIALFESRVGLEARFNSFNPGGDADINFGGFQILFKIGSLLF